MDSPDRLVVPGGGSDRRAFASRTLRPRRRHGAYRRRVPRRLVPALLLLALLVLLLVAGYLYGRSASCPPPEWWFRVFRQSGTYRCAG
ncbi:MAG: hypothetical protein JWM64_1519 [Frankiales bacterium]|nr:hypothetical protein [Frankiales bacterium]